MRLFLKKPIIWLALLALLTLLGSSSSLAFAAMNSTDAIINITNGDQTYALNVALNTNVTLNSGVLTVTDNDNSNDALEISYASPNYTITDTGGSILTTSITGATGSGTSSVVIPDTGVTGINFDVQGGDDSVTVNSVQASLTSGFTIAGGAGTDTASINSAISTDAGNISVTADTVNLARFSGALDTTTGTVTLTAEGDIALGVRSSITTTGGDVTLNSDRDETGSGSIDISASVLINSGGGNITLGGGANPATTPAQGTANSSGAGVRLDTADLLSGAGDISIRGTAGTGSTDYGVFVSARIQSTTGAIDIHGTSSTDSGIHIRTAVSSADGDITIVGSTAEINSSAGVIITGSSAKVEVGSGSLEVTGTATSGNSNGVHLSTSGLGRLLSTGAGSITITGTGAGSGSGLLAGGSSIIGGPSATGAITINTDTIDWSGTLSVESDGVLTIQPRTASTTIGLGGGAGTLNLTDDELGKLADGFSSITIGDGTNGTGVVDIDSATFLDPVTIAGGTINDNTGTDITAPSVTLDGNVSPGQSPGQLVVDGDVTFGSGYTLTLELNGTTAGTNYDQVQVTGSARTVTLTGATLTGTLGYTPDNPDELVIIDNVDSGSSVSGTFNGLAEGAEIAIGDYKFTITYAGGTGNDVVLGNPVPLAIDLALFETEADSDSILIRWQTVSELDNLGFNLYRATEIDGQQTQLNSKLIPAQAPGSGQGAEYEWLDRTVEAGGTYFYWLEDVDVNGITTMHGPISATANQTTAVTTTQLSTNSSRSGLAGLALLMLTFTVGGWLLRRQRR